MIFDVKLDLNYGKSDYLKLEELLNDCTVSVLKSASGEGGTGFFIAPGLVITCAHVIRANCGKDHDIRIIWRGKIYDTTIELCDTDSSTESSNLDIAFLRTTYNQHPCVLMHPEVNLGDNLYSYGFPDNCKNGDPITTIFEGHSHNPHMLKMKGGQVRPGMSGSPVLNLRTGTVCGIVRISRDRSTDLGGRAIPSSAIFQRFPDLIDKQLDFHSHDLVWIGFFSDEQHRILEQPPVQSPWLRIVTPASLTSTGLIFGMMRLVLSEKEGHSPYGLWEFAGPSSAFVRTLAADPKDPLLLYAGMQTEQGVFRSSDGGRSWIPRNDGLSNRNINIIVVSPYDGAVFVGTDSGSFKSTNHGNSWNEHSSYNKGKKVICIALSPHDPNLQISGTLKEGGTSALSETKLRSLKPSMDVEAGDFHITRDNGKTWQTYPIETINDAVISPLNSQVAYIVSGDSGLFKSNDGAFTWQKALQFKGEKPICVALSPKEIDRVVVGTLSGLYLSSDGGASWQKIEVVGDVQVADVMFLTNGTKNFILAATVSGVFESTDNGLTWRASNTGLVYLWAMTLATSQNGSIYVGTSGGGVYRKTFDQINWQVCNIGFLPVPVLMLAVSNNLLYAATGFCIFKSGDNGNSWDLISYFGRHVWSIAIAPLRKPVLAASNSGLFVSRDGGKTPQNRSSRGDPILTLYAGATEGKVYQSKDAGVSWKRIADLDEPNTKSPYRSGGRVFDIVLSPHDSNIIYANVEWSGLYRSIDEGRSWSKIDIKVEGIIVNSLHLSRYNDGIIYIGTLEHGMLKTEDNGVTWRYCKELCKSPITCITESHITKGLLFFCTVEGYVYRSKDGGISWDSIQTQNLNPEGQQNRWSVIAISPENDLLLYLGISAGAFWTSDGGEHWIPLKSGLLEENYQINSLAFQIEQEKYLYAAMREGIFRISM